MSKTMRSDRKPPLSLRSPIRLRPRPPLHSKSLNHLQTPSGYLTKSCMPKRSCKLEETELRPEYQTISCELKALSKMVQDNLSGSVTGNESGNAYNNENPLFQRGRFYDEYSARRNERLKRKRGESDAEKKTPCKQYLGVRVAESSKKATGEVRKYESARKMATPMVERREVAAMATATAQRYSLRSSMKENKRPPPLAMSFERTTDAATVGRKTTVRRTARKGY